MLVTYDERLTMEQARATYFEVNGFGPDGGYDDAWVDFALGPVKFPFPNTPSRVKAVRFHDLHHVITAYDTDIIGEFEISAWELGAGCKRYMAAWVLDLSGLIGGVFSAPRRTFQAFVRGRRSRSLFRDDFAPILARTLDDLRREHLPEGDAGPQTPQSWKAKDLVFFATAALAGVVVGFAFMAVAIPLLPFGFLAVAKAQRTKRQAMG